MKRLSDEQKRIEELQSVMNSVHPQSRSTPRSKATLSSQSKQTTQSSNQSTPHNTDDHAAMRQSDPRRRMSELDHEPSTNGEENAPQNQSSISQSYHGQISNDFSQPSIQAMSQSTDQPFVLHHTPTKKADIKKGRPSSNAQTESMVTSSTKSNSTMKRSNSNGFLSSSQLSRKKVGISKIAGHR